MGGTSSKVDHSTANVINTVKIIDHKDDIQDVNHNLKIVIAIFVFLIILKVVKMYKRSVQGRRDQKHALEQAICRQV